MSISLKPDFSLLFFLFTASLSVCTILFGKLDWIILFGCVFMALPFIKWKNLIIDKPVRWISLLFYLPFLISFVWSFALIPIINVPEYNNYIKTTFIFRSLHVFLFYILLLYGDQILIRSTHESLVKYLMIFCWGIILILGIFGVWQILGSIFHIWVPTIETRGDLYSARALGINRVTSIADEPSYLVPFLIDAILILFYLKRNKLVVLLSIVLLFSLSFGGYLESIILLSIYFLFSSRSNRIKLLCGLIIISLILILVFPEIIELGTQIIQSRKELQEGFDPSQTSRTAMIIYPISKWSEFDIVSLFLGYGPGSSKFLLESNPNEALFATSNNIYADLLYEEGILGVTCFIILMVKFWNSFKYVSKKQKIVSRLFLIHVALSSLYRADYSGARYLALFFIIIIFSKLFQKTEFSTKNELGNSALVCSRQLQ